MENPGENKNKEMKKWKIITIIDIDLVNLLDLFLDFSSYTPMSLSFSPIASV